MVAHAPASAILVLALAVLAGCKREPDFAERYDAASRQIGTKAKEIDAELARRAKEAEALDPEPDTATVTASPHSGPQGT